MSNQFGYIYILDYSDATICEIECDEEDNDADDVEYSLERRGVKLDNCSYMYTQNKIEQILKLETNG